MNLLERLKRASAAAADALKDIAERHGAEARVSIVISHPGTVEDSFVVGEHEMPELFAILTRIETGDRVECDVTSTAVSPDEPVTKGTVQ